MRYLVRPFNRFVRLRRRSSRVSLWFVLALLPLSGFAADRLPMINAHAWLLIDYETGNVLVERNADQRMAPASLTKLMTAYLLFERLKAGQLHLSDKVVISPYAAHVRGSRLRLRPGTEIAVEDLIKSMLVKSANDATTALAEHAAGSEARFVEEMNQRARAWGLDNTTFVNSTGLDVPGHLSTARDLSRIASALIRDFPDYYRWFSLRQFSFKDLLLHNSNHLLWRDSAVDGMKTGYTAQAGWCLIASAQQHETRLIATVLGAPNDHWRVEGAKRLLDYGFLHFETHLVYAANRPATEARIFFGDAAVVPLGVAQNLYVTVPRGMYSRLRARLSIQDMLYAPVRYGQRLGMLTLQLDDRVYAEYPLVALKEISSGGVMQRIIDDLQLSLR
ncbi:MAG: D-alanyl-D-alanine carboxypeptidase family protein [Sulfurifustaceae bacterium]